MDNASLHEILEKSPEQVGKKLQFFREKARETERVYATSFLRYKHGEDTTYPVEDAKQMALASESYDKAKAEEIRAEAEYRFVYERLVNARKQAELIAKGI